MTFCAADWHDLREARQRLEHPGVAARLTQLVGVPLEKGFAMLPRGVSHQVLAVTQTALIKASAAALHTVANAPGRPAHRRWHQLGVAATGAAGGFFGLAGLAVELPLSTTLMLRSVAEIARSEGESLAVQDTRRACLEVLALGGKARQVDPSDSSYFAIRAALASTVSEAGKHLATHKLTVDGAPMLVRLITAVAKRFGVQVTEKLAAQAVPALGAAGGAVINTVFLQHFQSMARGHFVVRRLERQHGAAAVRAAYDSLADVAAPDRRPGHA